MQSGYRIQGAIAGLTVIGISVLAIVGVVSGEDATNLYAIVLGYVFGSTVGRAVEKVEENRRNAAGAPPSP